MVGVFQRLLPGPKPQINSRIVTVPTVSSFPFKFTYLNRIKNCSFSYKVSLAPLSSISHSISESVSLILIPSGGFRVRSFCSLANLLA